MEERQETSPSEIYRVTRGQIEHYDNSVSQRVIWLSIGQSFFFNVYAVLVVFKAPTPGLFTKQQMLFSIFPIAALLVSVFSLIDVIAGFFYLRTLRKNYKNTTDGTSNESSYPLINGSKWDRISQHLSPIMVPIIFILTWSYLLLYDFKLL